MKVTALDTMPPGLPEYSLGEDAIAWVEEHLVVPDGPDAGHPWRYTPEQMKFLMWWYAIDEEGEWLYRRGVIRRSKGWGKDPLAATLCLLELMGPCRFAGWDNGRPLSRPEVPADIRLGAVAEKQTKNTSNLFSPMLANATRRKYKTNFREKVWRAEVNGVRTEILPTTAAARSEEGGRPTFFVANETEHWNESNGMKAMAETVERNLAKRNGRVVALANAHSPGELSVGEDDYKAWQQQQRPDYPGKRDILYACVEPVFPKPDFDPDNREHLMAGLKVAYGDSYWAPLTRYADEILDPKRSTAEAMRYYMNLIVAGEGKWMDPSEWERAEAPDFEPTATYGGGRRKRDIVLGFDGARRRDSTALVATDMETGTQWIAGLWERDYGVEDWEVDEAAVDAKVEEYFKKYRVLLMFCDPYWWYERVSIWEGRWNGKYSGRVASWKTGQSGLTKTAVAVHAYRNAIAEGTCKHIDTETKDFERHVMNVYARPINGEIDGVPLVKMAKEAPDSRRKIDVAMAGCLSWQARLAMIENGWKMRASTMVRSG